MSYAAEDFDESKLPGNPRLMQTFEEFMSEKEKYVKLPRGTEFECRACGDCCKWTFYKFKINLKRLRNLNPTPHGYWILGDRNIVLTMPYWREAMNTFDFALKLPEDHYEFHKVTQRRHGYWVLREDDYVCVYVPVKCPHLTGEGKCRIHGNHPKICRAGFCGRYSK